MKHQRSIIVFVSLVLLLISVAYTGISIPTAQATVQNSKQIQLLNIGDGQSSLTNQPTHSSSFAAKLLVPTNASAGSTAMALYPYNKPFYTLDSFQIFTSYTNALPRFVIVLDTNNDCSADLTLLSDYQFVGSGNWQFIQDGQRWGWTEATTSLDSYGKVWDGFYYWRGAYPNAVVLSVGVALEYWAVKDADGLGQPLYADEATINGITYNIANPYLPTGDDWSMYRQNPQRSGLATSAAPNGTLLWQFNTGDKIRASPTIANGVVYQGSNNGILYAIDTATGQVIWQYNSGSNIESSPAVTNGIVYVGILWDGHNGYIDALNATTGARIWRYSTNSGIESSPTVINGVVYIGSYAGYVYSLNATTGTLIWSNLTGGMVFSSPAMVNGVVYVCSGDGNVYALNAANGMRIWTHQTGNTIYASPAVVNDIVYVNTDNGAVYALRANNGSQIWQNNVGVGDHTDTSPAVAHRIVYIAARNGFYAFNATNGAQIWFFTSPYSPRQYTGYFYSCPAVAGNVAYFGSVDSYVFALDAYTGSMVWSYRLGGFPFASPAIANGVLYIGAYDGCIYALGGAGTQQPNTPSIPTPTATPTPTAIPVPTATPNPTATPAPTTTPNTTQTPLSTANPTPSQLSSANSVTQPDINRNIALKTNEADDTLTESILIGVGIVVTLVITLVAASVITKKKPLIN